MDERLVSAEVQFSDPRVAVQRLPSCGFAGHHARSVALDLIPDGWVVWLDDDTVLHPRFAAEFSAARRTHPEALGFVFWVGTAWGGILVSPLGPEDQIDGHGLVFSREAIGPLRWQPELAAADQQFHRDVVQRNGPRIAYVTHVAAVHNALR